MLDVAFRQRAPILQLPAVDIEQTLLVWRDALFGLQQN